MKKKTAQELASEKDAITIVKVLAIIFVAFVAWSDVFSPDIRIYMLAGITFSFFVARMGRERNIGYLKAFLISAIFSPVIGLIATLSSPRLADEEYKEKMLEVVENKANASTADQLHKLNELRKEGVLTDQEFEDQKYRLLNS